MYEFGLNYTKTQHSGHFGHTCTGTPWTCTGIGCILLACTGTGWTCTGTGWPLVACTGTPLYLYRCTLRNFAQKCFLFATFATNCLHTTSIIHIPQEFTWNSSKNNSIILVLVVWNSYHKTLGKNPMNSPKGPSILLKII